MNEITRIHLAKIPYEIEITAKKNLESYIRTLEAYIDESDWLQDIEIRMTEILDERGVKRNELITSDEVAVIRGQLGEPEDFYGEGDIAVGAQQKEDTPASRRLYRDPSTAMLAGVLSGIAHYLKISPIWTRLAFIALLFMSFGTVIVVYIVLWIVLPPADSVASQIELKGKSVTLATLKAHRNKIGGTGEVSRAAQVTQKILLYGFGTFASIAALGSFIFTTWVMFGLSLGTSENSPFAEMIPNTFNAWLGLGLLGFSGVLLSALFTLTAFVCFKRSLKKPVGIAIIAIIVAGIVSFGAGVTLSVYSQAERHAAIEASRTTKSVKLPDAFSGMKGLTIGSAEEDSARQSYDFIAVRYVVSDRAPRYEVTRDSETKDLAPAITIDDEGMVKVQFKDMAKERKFFSYTQRPSLVIYGPALQNVTLLSGSLEYQGKGTQAELSLDVQSGQLTLNGAYGTVTARVEASDLDTQNAGVDNLILDVKRGAVTAGVVRGLTLTQPEACPANRDSTQGRVAVQAVSSNKITFNGEERDAKSFTHVCGELIVGGVDEDEGDYSIYS